MTDQFSEKGVALHISSDSGAKYLVLSKIKTDSGVELLTRRTGSSGVSYSLVFFDRHGNYKYLGTGDTRAEAESKSNSDIKMNRIQPNSIKSEQQTYACS